MNSEPIKETVASLLASVLDCSKVSRLAGSSSGDLECAHFALEPKVTSPTNLLWSSGWIVRRGESSDGG
jgi:hypothetical protein